MYVYMYMYMYIYIYTCQVMRSTGLGKRPLADGVLRRGGGELPRIV